jgi:hypothetical protein
MIFATFTFNQLRRKTFNKVGRLVDHKKQNSSRRLAPTTVKMKLGHVCQTCSPFLDCILFFSFDKTSLKYLSKNHIQLRMTLFTFR